MAAEAFKAARDFLFEHRTDYRAAHAGFRWPQLDHFNYALDWFDAELARGESADRPALTIVGDGAATATFAELSERSNRIANGLRALGVKRGERILLMLGNVVPLWEVMLAAMKLGAVVIPASTLLTPNDLKDRFERGRVRHLVANAALRSATRQRAGMTTTACCAAMHTLCRRARRGPPIRCCYTSPPARLRDRSWWSTVIKATRSAI